MLDICESIIMSSCPLTPLIVPLLHRESASALEAESGYTLEASEVSQFRRYILEGQWTKAEAILMHIGVVDEEGMLVQTPLSLCATQTR